MSDNVTYDPERLIPTMSLRFVRAVKTVPRPELGDGIAQEIPFLLLQQRFETNFGRTVWRDVPLDEGLETMRR